MQFCWFIFVFIIENARSKKQNTLRIFNTNFHGNRNANVHQCNVMPILLTRFFLRRQYCQSVAQSQSWKYASSRLSTIVYSIYSQHSPVSGGRLVQPPSADPPGRIDRDPSQGSRLRNPNGTGANYKMRLCTCIYSLMGGGMEAANGYASRKHTGGGIKLLNTWIESRNTPVLA